MNEDTAFNAIKDDNVPEKYKTMDELSRSKKLLSKYIKHYGNETFKTDFDGIKKEFKFLYDDEDDVSSTWEKQFAKKYYDKLFKEFCLVDLSKYKDRKVGMRWRLEKEVLSGKGQYICGEINCKIAMDLYTMEVNFAYKEDGTQKQALVKVKLCPDCAKKLKKAQTTKESTEKKKRKRDEM
jgi:protein FRA10AC1